MKKYILLSSLTILFFSCGKKEELATAEMKTITETVYASGNLVPQEEYVLRAQTEGILEALYVKEGDSVTAGKVLMKINNSRTSTDLETAYEVYNTTLQTSGKYAPALSEAEARWESAKIKFKTDSLNYSRYKKLFSEKAASANELEQTELRYTQSRSELTSAQKQVELLRLNLNNDLTRAKGNYRNAETGANYGKPEALYRAMVFELNKKVGDYVRPGDALALLGAGKLIAKLKIDEGDFAKIKPGQKVLVSGDVFGDRIIEGKVLRILPRMNEREQSFTVEAELPDIALAPVYGLNCEADIVVADKRQALLIPKDYLLPGDSVNVKNENGAAKVKVKPGIVSGNYVEILEGLTAQAKLLKK